MPTRGAPLRSVGGCRAAPDQRQRSGGAIGRPGAVARSAPGCRARQPAEAPGGAATKQQPPAPPPVSVFGNLHAASDNGPWHPGRGSDRSGHVGGPLLNVDHSNWVFWTAFVVIAGSTGESLRKMMLRVAGTVGGATIGVALALVTPDNTLLVVLVATACIFLTIYFSPVSYPQMVFWLNIGFVMVYTRLGAQELDLLFARPFTALLGALVAALVVVFVFPIRMTDRFKAAAARFLGAVDGFVAAFVDAVTGGRRRSALDAAQAKVATTYAQVEQTLPGVAFENNPLLQAQSPLTQQATRLPRWKPRWRGWRTPQPSTPLRPAMPAMPTGCAQCRHGFIATSRRSCLC